jgi:uncharacterized protein with ParB-like and HNH nuclease domain
MREIQGDARTVKELLKGRKYSIDYYQREYKWGSKQIHELINDLTSRFLDDYEKEHHRDQVSGYGHYFLGPIIISYKDNMDYLVDGQQRLTSLTLLLIHLRNLQRESSDQVNIDELIFSEKYGEKTFNLQVPERLACMETLFDGYPFDENDQPESIHNIIARYQDIVELLPEEVTNEALPFFIDWLTENVHLVEITAYSDEDAYTIFETMNDRGLSLSPTDMLKGLLLSNINDKTKRNNAEDMWKQRIQELQQADKEAPGDCFKTWLRSQYANKIRERKKDAHPEDFDLIGTEFHRWVRNNSIGLGLTSSDDYYTFIKRDFDFYSKQYLKLFNASETMIDGLEHVFYNAAHGFTLQHILLLAPLKSDDTSDVIRLKIRLVAIYLDILLTRRLWNSHSIAYSTMQYAMFTVMRDIRALDPEQLADTLFEKLEKQEENFSDEDYGLYVHQQNRKYLHRILARITDFIEKESVLPSHYLDYVNITGNSHFEVEHIWADKPERHVDEFTHPNDFQEYRNYLGGLLLLPKKFNASYGALPYDTKHKHYDSQNLLARSLHPLCYDHNPGFLDFVKRSHLPFQPHNQFKMVDLDERHELYRQIAQQVWNPELLRKELEE